MKELDSVPLFMRDLPTEENTALEALQTLAYDGPPDEVAENFKNQGNEYFRAKRYKEALGFYQQGIQAESEDAKLKETLYLNCAACHLELHNFGSALHAARDAIVTNPRSVKALYRAARAFLALNRTKDARGCCDLALGIDPDNTELIRLQGRVDEHAARLERLEAERTERKRRATRTEEALQVAFVARGLWLTKSSDPPDNPTPAHFDPESLPSYASPDIPLVGAKQAWKAPDPIRTPVIFPVMLLYPQHNTSDLISEYHEDTPIGMHLEVMFPLEARGSLPWDAQGEYVANRLSVIAKTRKGRLLRVGHKLSLRELLDQGATPSNDDRDGIVLRDGIIDLYVLPKGSDAERQWITANKAS